MPMGTAAIVATALGSAAIGAGGSIGGSMLSSSGGRSPKMVRNPWMENILNQIMAEYWEVKREYSDLLKAKPWRVDQGEVHRAEKLMGQIDEAIKGGDSKKAQDLISKLPYFEQMYRDKILYKHPQLSQMIQSTAITWGKGLRTPAQDRLWTDITGSSRRMLGKERDQALRDAERMAVLAGRSGLSRGESDEILNAYLGAYTTNEKSIRTQNTQDLLEMMKMGIGLGQEEREYGRSEVQRGISNKMNAQQLVNQLLGSAAGAAGGVPIGTYTPKSSKEALGQGISTGANYLASGMENAMGALLVRDLLNESASSTSKGAGTETLKKLLDQADWDYDKLIGRSKYLKPMSRSEYNAFGSIM